VADLLMIVPSRGRPESVSRVVEAWQATDGYEHADLMFAVDADDPTLDGYYAQDLPSAGRPLVKLFTVNRWMPMVHKLNLLARQATADNPYFALGFAGDDHLPRTRGWSGRFVEVLQEMGTGVVYGNDLLQGERLCTSWVMTSDIVRALGRMVPAPVEHMYCDNSVMDLASSAGCMRYLPDVVVEHCHPLAGKAAWDPGYLRVNSRHQFSRDQAAYQHWLAHGLAGDLAQIHTPAIVVQAG
jgi:hypothetical protein